MQGNCRTGLGMDKRGTWISEIQFQGVGEGTSGMGSCLLGNEFEETLYPGSMNKTALYPYILKKQRTVHEF